MSLALANVEAEVKSRARVLGAFTAGASVERLRYAEQFALLEVWNRHDWDFKNSTATIATSQGNLGPYDAPSGLVRFAQTRKRAFFGFKDAHTLVPIQPTDAQEYTPYLLVQNGKIYFFQDPGAGSLTLNYLGQTTDSIEEADLTTFMALFPTGLKNAVVTLSYADLLRDIPGRTQETDMLERRGLQYVDNYWEDSTRGTVQTQIAPKGLGGQQIDGMARQINVLGDLVVRFIEGEF